MKKTTITNKKEMINKIGNWTTVEINCIEYDPGSSKLIISYKGEEVTYLNQDKLNVCWFAMQANGASNKDYERLREQIRLKTTA